MEDSKLSTMGTALLAIKSTYAASNKQHQSLGIPTIEVRPYSHRYHRAGNEGKAAKCSHTLPFPSTTVFKEQKHIWID